jgi:hypothetical protein
MFDARIRAPANVVDRREAWKLTRSKRANLPLPLASWVERRQATPGVLLRVRSPTTGVIARGLAQRRGAADCVRAASESHCAPSKPLRRTPGAVSPVRGLGRERYGEPLASKSDWPVGVQIVSRTCPDWRTRHEVRRRDGWVLGRHTCCQVRGEGCPDCSSWSAAEYECLFPVHAVEAAPSELSRPGPHGLLSSAEPTRPHDRGAPGYVSMCATRAGACWLRDRGSRSRIGVASCTEARQRILQSEACRDLRDCDPR